MTTEVVILAYAGLMAMIGCWWTGLMLGRLGVRAWRRAFPRPRQWWED